MLLSKEFWFDVGSSNGIAQSNYNQMDSFQQAGGMKNNNYRYMNTCIEM